MTARSTASRFLTGLVDPATYSASLHLVTDLLVGTVTFTLLVTLLALAGGLMVTLVGLPLLLLTLLVARGIAGVERRRAGTFLGADVEPALVRGRRLRDRLLDPADWRAVLYGIALFPLGVVNASVTIAGWATTVAAITAPVYADPVDGRVPGLGRIDLEGPVAAVLVVATGLVLLFVMPFVVRGLVRVDERLVRRLLG